MASLPHDTIPLLLRGLIDDAAVFPPGNAALRQALQGHQDYRTAWYAPMVGPLLLPASKLPDIGAQPDPLRIGLVADTGITAVAAALAALPDRVTVAQIETPAADDTALRELRAAATDWKLPVFAEIPFERLDLLAEFDSGLTPKFRTGGLDTRAFPSPSQLAQAIVECAADGLGFKLTAGLHHAIRHSDPATGFVHHGFANVLLAAIQAANGEDANSVTQTLEITESEPVAQPLRGMLGISRPLWVGFGSCSVTEPLDDLIGLSLLHKPDKES